ncbi:MAG: hypothetical protein H6852_10725 [Geminicoccaceae bacterium]|nr:hypothetical protein [Geminicoccaceae bacterium]HRY22893.1 hypothetical protein [Geminicoccaceae bacterium]
MTCGVALAYLLAGCQAAPPPLSASSPAPVDTVRSNVAAALEREGLVVEKTAGGLRATSDAERFTKCVPVLVGGSSGSDSSRKMIRVDERSATAIVRFTSRDGGTRADWHTSYSGRYYDIIRNDHFTKGCEGTGTLEALLTAAVAG